MVNDSITKNVGGIKMDLRYIVFGVFRHPHKDCVSECQYCETYDDALALSKEWKKERKYKDVFVVVDRMSNED